MFNYTFKRVEKKYLLSKWQYELIKAAMKEHMTVDEYGLSSINNIYYDTENYDLIRASIEAPVYKEKLRLRSYGTPGSPDDTVFIELKKKYKGVVYKRRESMTYREAMDYLNGIRHPSKDTQILREIDYFLAHYDPKPKEYIAYDRIATYGRDDPSLRITYDFNIRSRNTDLELMSGDANTEPLLPEGDVLMEIKASGAYPMWLTEILSRLKIYPCGFSKYGYVYKEELRSRGSEAADIELNNLITMPTRPHIKRMAVPTFA